MFKIIAAIAAVAITTPVYAQRHADIVYVRMIERVQKAKVNRPAEKQKEVCIEKHCVSEDTQATHSEKDKKQ